MLIISCVDHLFGSAQPVRVMNQYGSGSFADIMAGMDWSAAQHPGSPGVLSLYGAAFPWPLTALPWPFTAFPGPFAAFP